MANGLIQSWVVSRAHFKSDNWDVRLMKLMSFSSLLRREIWISSVVSMIAASIVTLLVAFVYLHLASVDKTEKMERVVQVNVERYLTRGWVDHNLQQVYQEMRKQFPDDVVYLLAGPAFRESKELTALPPDVASLIGAIEAKRTPQSSVNFVTGYVKAGYPLFFEGRCLQCHAGSVKVGDYAGTFVFKSPLSDFQVSLSAMLVFMLVFIVFFLLSLRWLLMRSLTVHIRTPIQNLIYRIQSMRLDEDELIWDTAEQRLIEMKEIEQAIGEQVQKLKGMHHKMDALYVTEHETGFFHKDRFKEALTYEVFRSSRYHHSFALVLVKVVDIHASEGCQMSAAEKIHVFASQLGGVLRSSDMGFRINEQLFAILMPETGVDDVVLAVHSFTVRFNNHYIDCGDKGQVRYDIEQSYAVYPDEATTPDALIQLSTKRLRVPTTAGVNDN